MNERPGHYMRTFTGVMFYPLDPRVEDMNIVDIAHGLAFQCRFNGQTSGFYSVAEHSVHCSYIGPPEEARERLMHDAAEAYIGDMIRPLKYSPELHAPFSKIDAAVEAKIAERFGLVYPWPASVKIADEQTVNQELRDLMHGDEPASAVTHAGFGYADIKIECWKPHIAYRNFMMRYVELEQLNGRTKAEIFHEIDEANVLRMISREQRRSRTS